MSLDLRRQRPPHVRDTTQPICIARHRVAGDIDRRLRIRAMLAEHGDNAGQTPRVVTGSLLTVTTL